MRRVSIVLFLPLIVTIGCYSPSRWKKPAVNSKPESFVPPLNTDRMRIFDTGWKFRKGEIDDWIKVIGKAQEDDGYLYSPRSAPSERIKRGIGPERWSNLQWSHELYVLGHLYEAAVAYYIATGKKSLLNIALKSAELVINTFNPDGLQIPPGHQEIEIG